MEKASSASASSIAPGSSASNYESEVGVLSPIQLGVDLALLSADQRAAVLVQYYAACASWAAYRTGSIGASEVLSASDSSASNSVSSSSSRRRRRRLRRRSNNQLRADYEKEKGYCYLGLIEKKERESVAKTLRAYPTVERLLQLSWRQIDKSVLCAKKFKVSNDTTCHLSDEGDSVLTVFRSVAQQLKFVNPGTLGALMATHAGALGKLEYSFGLHTRVGGDVVVALPFESLVKPLWVERFKSHVKVSQFASDLLAFPAEAFESEKALENVRVSADDEFSITREGAISWMDYAVRIAGKVTYVEGTYGAMLKGRQKWLSKVFAKTEDKVLRRDRQVITVKEQVLGSSSAVVQQCYTSVCLGEVSLSYLTESPALPLHTYHIKGRGSKSVMVLVTGDEVLGWFPVDSGGKYGLAHASTDKGLPVMSVEEFQLEASTVKQLGSLVETSIAITGLIIARNMVSEPFRVVVKALLKAGFTEGQLQLFVREFGSK